MYIHTPRGDMDLGVTKKVYLDASHPSSQCPYDKHDSIYYTCMYIPYGGAIDLKCSLGYRPRTEMGSVS